MPRAISSTPTGPTRTRKRPGRIAGSARPARPVLRCVCHREPRGDNGLEGYNAGEQYQCTEHRGPLRGRGVVRYFRIYPSALPPNDSFGCADYYEVARPGVFTRFFTLLEAQV